MSQEEKVEFGAARKEKSSELSKASRLQMALQRYKQVGDMYSYIDKFQNDSKKSKDIKKAYEPPSETHRRSMALNISCVASGMARRSPSAMRRTETQGAAEAGAGPWRPAFEPV
eukprot:9110987-Pyramimonas_sp.AAC.1